jgi:hypothetical protein
MPANVCFRLLWCLPLDVPNWYGVYLVLICVLFFVYGFRGPCWPICRLGSPLARSKSQSHVVDHCITVSVYSAQW